MNVLITTLGHTWTIIPELIGFTNPCILDLYKNHPGYTVIEDSRRLYKIKPVNRLAVITTDANERAVQALQQWHTPFRESISILILVTDKINDITDLHSVNAIKGLVYKTVHYFSLHSGGDLYLSLTGGRKTMSADLQNAAFLCGSDAVLHVIDIGNLPKELRKPRIEHFQMPLPSEHALYFMPVIAGSYKRKKLVIENDFNLAGSTSFELRNIDAGELLSFSTTLQELQEKSHNYYLNLAGGGNHYYTSNFRLLYTLPAEQIIRLQKTRFGLNRAQQKEELAFLKDFPKTELHCHLGGVADAEELIEIAATNSEHVETYKDTLAHAFADLKQLISEGDHRAIKARTGYLKNYFKQMAAQVPYFVKVSFFLLLFKNNPKLLDTFIYDIYTIETNYKAIGIDCYIELGDLQGSSILQSEGAIKKATNLLIKKLTANNVKYIEIRCSPVNYTDGGLEPTDVIKYIYEEFTAYNSKALQKINWGLIFIASRHGKLSNIMRHVELIEEIISEGIIPIEYILGIDLAGQEGARNPERIREYFLPIMEKYINITIHAGETEDFKNIWEAIYHLNAERIGHGLSLVNNQDLIKKVLDRKISIEMCPSSNDQIVGFRDNYEENSHFDQIYPLKIYLERGIRVTVNTDNPGISRTDQTRELHKAARMTPGGLSLWDMLQLIYNGFKSAFTEYETRRKMIIEAEKEIMDILERWV